MPQELVGTVHLRQQATYLRYIPRSVAQRVQNADIVTTSAYQAQLLEKRDACFTPHAERKHQSLRAGTPQRRNAVSRDLRFHPRVSEILSDVRWHPR